MNSIPQYLYDEASSENTAIDRLRFLAVTHLSLAILVARNPNADAELLTELSFSKDCGVRAGITINPNTPLAILWKLATNFPQELLANPILSLLPLENPNFIQQIPEKTLKVLVEQNNIPEWFLAKVLELEGYKYNLVFAATAENPITPEHILDVLIDKKRNTAYVYNAIAQRQNISKTLLSKVFIEGNIGSHIYLVKNPQTPQDVINGIAKYGSLQAQLYLVKNTSTSLDVIETIAKYGKSEPQLYLLQQAKIPAHIIETIAEYGKGEAQLYITKQPHISNKLLEYIADTREGKYNLRSLVREAVAKHPNTSEHTLEKLAFDVNIKVRKAVARRRDLTISLIFKMALDRQISRKRLLLGNRNISESMLKVLSNYREPRILRLIALHPNTSVCLLRELAIVPEAQQLVVQNLKTPVEILEKLALNTDRQVQLAIAKNYNTPIQVLSVLAKSTLDTEILIAIIENTKTSLNSKKKLLEILSRDRRLSVRQYVAKHPDTPEKILVSWAKQKCFKVLHSLIAKNISTPALILDKLARDADPYIRLCVRIAVAENPIVPSSILESIFNSYGNKYTHIYRELRVAIAKHPNTPAHILENLLIRNYCSVAIAANPNTPVYLLEKLAESQNISINIALTKNPNCSQEILKKSLEKILKRTFHIENKIYVAQHPSTPIAILEQLSQAKNSQISKIARHQLKKRQKNNYL